MSLSRSLLLRASRSDWLADQFRRRSFARPAVRRFLPGEEMGDALAAAATFAQDGIGAVLTHLGEQVHSRDEAMAVRRHYLRVLDEIAERGLPAEISVKLTHLGLDVDPEECVESVRRLAVRAAEIGARVWIDMEESVYADRTLDVFRRVRAENASVGLCLQAYLRRTPADLESLLPLDPAIRLVKGAYREPAQIAFDRKRDTDRAYLRLAERLIENASAAAPAVFGTHDPDLIRAIRARVEQARLDHGRCEIHMLYGIKPELQRELAGTDVGVRVLISYGEHWFPWYMRRLAERPANVWFVVRNVFG